MVFEHAADAKPVPYEVTDGPHADSMTAEGVRRGYQVFCYTQSPTVLMFGCTLPQLLVMAREVKGGILKIENYCTIQSSSLEQFNLAISYKIKEGWQCVGMAQNLRYETAPYFEYWVQYMVLPVGAQEALRLHREKIIATAKKETHGEGFCPDSNP